VLTEPDIRGALPALQKYARALTRHAVDAEDLVQDTLTQAWAQRARYYGGDARAWLFTVMHNLHVSKIRRRSCGQNDAADCQSSTDIGHGAQHCAIVVLV
jgi:DNA-directed RNA polymerase specialized sigma24 family protein